MFLTHWLQAISARSSNRPSVRRRQRRNLRQTVTDSSARQIQCIELLEDRTLLTSLFQGELLPDAALAPFDTDQSGSAVTVSGDWLVVGIPNADPAGIDNAGAVTLYTRNDSGTPDDQTDDSWDYHSTLVSPRADNTDQDLFGTSVAIDGDTLLIGAIGADEGDTFGSAYLFRRNEQGTASNLSDDTWDALATLSRPVALANGAAEDFGLAVDLKGNTAVVGAQLDSYGAAASSGAVYVFTTDDDWATVSVDQLKAGDASTDAWLGSAVAISQDETIIIAGAVQDQGKGAAYLFERSSNGAGVADDTWGEIKKLSGTTGSDLGSAVDIDDRYAAVGAAGDTYGGSVSILDGSQSWNIVEKLRASEYPNSTDSGGFGSAVSIAGMSLVVGDPLSNGSTGAAYLFEGSLGWSTAVEESLIAADTETGSGYGSAIAIDGETIVSGAPLHDHGTTDTGSAYVFGFPPVIDFITQIVNGDLLIDHQTVSDSNLSMTISGGQLIVSVVDNLITAPVGGTQIDAQTIAVSLSMLTGSTVYLTGGAGNEQVTLDTSLAAAGLRIDYDGDDGSGDDTIILSGSADSLSSWMGGSQSGWVRLNEFDLDFLFYSHQDRMIWDVATAHLDLNYDNDTQTIDFNADLSGGFQVISGSGPELKVLQIPSTTLNLNSGAGLDYVNINSVGQDGTADLIITETRGDDWVEFGNSLDLGSGDLELHVNRATFGENVTTTGNVHVEAASIFTDSTTPLNTGGGDIYFESTGLNLGEIITTGDVWIDASASIIDNNGSSNNITAARAVILSGSSTNSMETQVGYLEVATVGFVQVQNTGDLVIGDAGDLTGIYARDSTIYVNTTGSLDVRESIQTGTSLSLYAGGDITIRAGVIVKSEDSSFGVSLVADDDILVEEGAQLIALTGGVGLEAKNMVADNANIAVELWGQTHSADGTSVYGGVNSDVFYITPSLESEITVNGLSPATPGDTLFYNEPTDGAYIDYDSENARLDYAGGYQSIYVTGIENLEAGFSVPAPAHLMIKGTSGDDVLTITASDNNSGSYQLNAGPVVNFFSISSLEFYGFEGDDQLIINNPAGGVFAPEDGIYFDGGDGGETSGDHLEISGGIAVAETHHFLDESQGRVFFNAATRPAIQYAGLEQPVDSTVSVDRLSLSFSGVSTLSEAGVDELTYESDVSQLGTFLNPALSLTVNSGNWNSGVTSEITIDSLGENFNADLNLGQGVGSETVYLGAGLDLDQGNLLSLADTTRITGAIILNGDVEVVSSILSFTTSDSSIDAGSGKIHLESSTSWSSGQLTTTGDVNLIAGNGHLSLQNSTENTITAGLLELTAEQGSILNMTTDVDQLVAVAKGVVRVRNTGDLILGSAAVQTAWKGIRSHTNIIDIESEGGIDIHESMSAGIGILLASVDGDPGSLAEDLTVRSGVKIEVANGTITFNSADDILIESGAQLVAGNSSIALNLSVITTDFQGGELALFGQLSAVNGAQLTGSVFADTFHLSASSETEITVNGESPAAPTSPADSLYYYSSPGAVPEVTPGGTDSGTISFTGGLETIDYSEIEEVNLQGVLWVEGTEGDDELSILATELDSGTFQFNGGSVVSFTSLTQLVFAGGEGDDILSIQNPDGGLFTPAEGILFDGGFRGETSGDALEILGGSASTVEHRFVDENSGSIHYNGSATQTITYTGLEPILDTIETQNRSFSFTGADETITLSDDGVAGDSYSLIDSTLGESVTFLNPTDALAILTQAAGGTGADTVNLNGLDSSFSADLFVTPGSDDAVNVGNLDLGAGDLTLSGIVSFNGAFTTTGGVIVDSAGDLTFAAGGSLSAGVDSVELFAESNLYLGSITTPNQIQLTASGGSIIDANGAAENLNGYLVTLIASGGIGAGDALESSIVGLQANSGGGLSLENTGMLFLGFSGGIEGVTTNGTTRITATDNMTVYESVTAAGGLLQLENTGGDFLLQNSATISNTGASGIDIDSAGSITLVEGTRIESSGTGLIDVQSVNNLLVANLQTSGTVQLTSTAGAIRDNLPGEGPLVESETLILQAATGIGGAGTLDLDTEVNSITAHATQGPIMIDNYGELFVQLPELLDLVLDEDALEQTIDLSQITTAGGNSQPLTVIAQSSQPSLIPDPQVNYAAADTTANLVFTPIANQSGVATITLVISDGGTDYSTETTGDNRTIYLTFDVTVNSLNDDPELDSLSDLLLLKNASEQTVNLSGISAGGGETQPIRVTAQSSLPGLIADPVVNYTSDDATGSLVFTPITDQTGTTTITVTVEDGGLDNNLLTTEDNATITRTFDVVVQEFETLSMRVVETPTSVGGQGEIETLPDHQAGISEWNTYWVEFWVNTIDVASLGIATVTLDLNYQTDFTTATDIGYGTAFSQNQTGTIDDLTGQVTSLSATVDTIDLGIDGQLLFARIRFDSLADDQVLLDLEGQSIGPYDLGLQIQSPQITLGSGRISQTPIIDSPGASIWANPYDLNDDDRISFRDLLLFASVYNSVPAESSSDYAWFSDINQNQRVDFKDLIFLASNYNKTKLSQANIIYPTNYPDAWNQNLEVALAPQTTPEATALTQSQADTMLQTAVLEVSPTVSSAEQQKLANVKVEVVDLEGSTLGRVVGDTIYIDVNAAGYGWFVDTTPLDHSEYTYDSQLSLIALPGSEAAGLIDLWTVIRHELGHLLGAEHTDEGLMTETLDPGVRKLTESYAETDQFFGSLEDETELLSF